MSAPTARVLAELPPLEGTPGVSYIMPVLEEADSIRDAVSTILAQDYEGEKEIVLALGPSQDDTNAIVAQMQAEDARIRTVDNPQGSTPVGLNLAIAATRFPVVIRVDAHSELSPGYTRDGIAALRATGAANLGGLMRARGRTPFQKAVARAYMSKVGLGGPAYHAGDEPGPAESAYLGVFRREVFDRLGTFDESLRRGQDWELNLRIRDAGGLVWFDPDLEVTYWPRATWTKVVRQFHATGVWRAELIRRYGGRNSLRYFAPPVLVLGLGASLVEFVLQLTGTTRRWPRWLSGFTSLVHVPSLGYAVGIVGVTLRAKDAGLRERLWFALVLPTIHISWGSGFLKGLFSGAGDTVDTSR